MKNWKLIKTKRVFDGWIKLREDTFLLNDKKESYIFIESKDSAAVLAIKNKKVLLLKQFRVPLKKTIYNLPGGFLNLKEKPGEGARREFLEETGYRAKKMKKICEFYVDPGTNQRNVHLFFTKNIEKVREKIDEREEVKLIFMSANELFKKIIKNEIKDNEIIISFLIALQKNLISL